MSIEMVVQKVPMPSVRLFGVLKSAEMIVTVPSAVLTKDVNVGDELVLYVPKKEQPEKRKALTIAQKPVAKAKASK